MPELLAQGKLKEGLLVASRHPDPVIRKRFTDLRLLLEDGLGRPRFDVIHDRRSNRIDIVEPLPAPANAPAEVSLDLAGLGLAQVYSILAQALLRGTDVVGIEEPEAHVHAPTTGLTLRRLLARLVTDGYLQQLFVATHSNLFDLDEGGYWDVAHDAETGTSVTRKPLHEIDRLHLYEPGPAKHALIGFMEYMDDDAIAFRRPDGEPISMREMRDLLQRDDPLALDFLRDVHAAAVRAVRVKSKKPADS